VDIKLSDNVAEEALRGKTVQATFDVKEIKSLRLPEMTTNSCTSSACIRPTSCGERLMVLLNRRLEYQQRQSAREQVLTQLAAATQWDLPQDLLQRQARRAFNRRVVEMQSAGMSDDEIRGQIRCCSRIRCAARRRALKEHFVLQKIAEVEKLDIDEQDIDMKSSASPCRMTNRRAASAPAWKRKTSWRRWPRRLWSARPST